MTQSGSLAREGSEAEVGREDAGYTDRWPRHRKRIRNLARRLWSLLKKPMPQFIAFISIPKRTAAKASRLASIPMRSHLNHSLLATQWPRILIPRPGGSHPEYAAGKEYLMSLAKFSGGLFVDEARTDNLGSAFRKIAEELWSQYSIGYYTRELRHDKKFRDIDTNRRHVLQRYRGTVSHVKSEFLDLGVELARVGADAADQFGQRLVGNLLLPGANRLAGPRFGLVRPIAVIHRPAGEGLHRAESCRGFCKRPCACPPCPR